MDKKFTFGLIALLSGSLFLLGCRHDGVRISVPKTPEQLASELVKALGGPANAKAVGAKVTLLKDTTVSGDITVAAGVTLDTDGKTLVIQKNFTVGGNVNMDAAVTPAGDVTVGTKGTIAVSRTGILTIAAGKTLANNGTVALTNTGSVELKTPATASATNGAKITGDGKLMAQDLDIVGGTNGWQALLLPTGSAATNVTIASTATAGQASITGGLALASLKGGTGATITQKAGTTNNKLTLTTVTVDVSAAGSLTLKGAASNIAKLELTGATAVVKGSGGVGSGSVANITSLGGVLLANLGISGLGSNTIISGGATGSGAPFNTIIGGSSSTGAIAPTANLVLDKDTILILP